MRVLWLTQVQLPAVTGSPSMTGGGWLEGLRLALEIHEPSLELGIVSWGSVAHTPFSRGNATYSSINPHRPENRLMRAAEQWRHEYIPPEAALVAATIAERFRPDVVHVHGTEHSLGLAALRLGVPSVATLQGIATVIERFMLASVPCIEVLRNMPTRRFLRGEGFLHDFLRMKRRAATERVILTGLHNFIGQTEWDRSVLKLMNPSAAYFRGHCIVQPVFYSQRWSQPARGTPTVFCASSAPPYKGLGTLLEGIALLREAGRQDVRLRVAGPIDGSPAWPMLTRLSQRRGLQGFVTWLGPLRADELASELVRATVFVLPSHIENTPNSLIEAMLLGVPCVASAVGGVAEMLDYGSSGIPYHDSDPFALAAALATVLDDRDLARSLGEKARTQARQRFDPELGARRTREIYEQIVAQASASAPRSA